MSKFTDETVLIIGNRALNIPFNADDNTIINIANMLFNDDFCIVNRKLRGAKAHDGYRELDYNQYQCVNKQFCELIEKQKSHAEKVKSLFRDGAAIRRDDVDYSTYESPKLDFC